MVQQKDQSFRVRQLTTWALSKLYNTSKLKAHIIYTQMTSGFTTLVQTTSLNYSSIQLPALYLHLDLENSACPPLSSESPPHKNSFSWTVSPYFLAKYLMSHLIPHFSSDPSTGSDFVISNFQGIYHLDCFHHPYCRHSDLNQYHLLLDLRHYHLFLQYGLTDLSVSVSVVPENPFQTVVQKEYHTLGKQRMQLPSHQPLQPPTTAP